MAFSGLIAGGKNGTSTGCTTDAVDTTGKDIICVFASWFGNGSASISDSKGNTWSTNGKVYDGGITLTNLQMWWCVSPTVGSGHTFTVMADYCSAGYVAAAGADTAAAFDQEVTAVNTSSTTHQPGSLTPGENDCLVVTAIGTYPENPSGVDGTYAEVLVNYSSGNGLGLGIGCEAQTTATATNPTWTLSGAVPAAVLVASFHAAAGGGGGKPMYAYQQQ